MIVKNGAATLGRALESVCGIADEVVIVDTGSSDGTRALAESLGARVVPFQWCDDFSAARNAALEAARGEWVLALDADEALAPDSAVCVRAFIEGGRFDAGDVGIVNELRPGETLQRISHRYCRLFRKRAGVRFEGRVHEQVLPSLVRTGARIGTTGARVLHSGYGGSVQVLRAKQERNLRLLRQAIEESPDDPFLRFHLGVTLFALGERDAARGALLAALPGNTLPPEALSLAHVKLAQVAIAAREFDRARAHLAEARELRPRSALVAYLGAGLDFWEGRFGEAARVLETLLAEDGGGDWEEGLDPAELNSDLGNCRYRLGDFEGAEAAYAAALEQQPGAAKLAYNLGNSVYQQGRYEEAHAWFERALQLDPALEAASENQAQCRVKVAQAWAAAEPANAEAALALALALLDAGSASEAARAFEIACRLDPGLETPRAA